MGLGAVGRQRRPTSTSCHNDDGLANCTSARWRAVDDESNPHLLRATLRRRQWAEEPKLEGVEPPPQDCARRPESTTKEGAGVFCSVTMATSHPQHLVRAKKRIVAAPRFPRLAFAMARQNLRLLIGLTHDPQHQKRCRVCKPCGPSLRNMRSAYTQEGSPKVPVRIQRTPHRRRR